MTAKFKAASSVGSATPDPVKDSAALTPIPTQALENKPAPGQTGPKGMSPRTTYSRVNTGSPPVMDAGATPQKSGPNMGMSFLPAKMAADRGFMATSFREQPSLQSMVKAAMEGATRRLATNMEAERQDAQQSGVKTASARAPVQDSESVPTELVMKLASALDFIEGQILKEAEGPGEGPGALRVMEATSNDKPLEPGTSGQATAQHQPPRNPQTQSEEVQSGNAGTGLETNDDTTHPEQPVEPIKNASSQLVAGNLERLKAASAKGLMRLGRIKAKKGLSAAGDVLSGRSARESFGKYRSAKGNLEVAEKMRTPSKMTDAIKGDVKEHGSKAMREGAKTLGAYAGIGAVGGGAAAAARSGKKKESSAPIALIRKLAEDAINPAHISSPANVDPAKPPPGASASEEGVPAEPSDVTSQKRMISSNQAAIDYTKGEAKADPKKDVNQVLEEPALSSATDKVLEQAFDATGQAGVKISSAGGMRKSAMQIGAQRVILDRLLAQASEQVRQSTGASA